MKSARIPPEVHSHMNHTGKLALVLFALLMVAVQPTKADSFFANASIGGSFGNSSSGTGPNFSTSPQSFSQSATVQIPGAFQGTTIGSATVNAIASAAPGQLGLAGISTMNLTNFAVNGFNAGAGGNATFNMDLVISGPQGTSGLIIPTSINTNLTGSFGANANGSGLGGVFSGSAGAGLISNSGGGGFFSLGQFSGNSTGAFSGSGVFGGLGVPVASPVFTVVENQPFTVTMSFGLNTLAFANNFSGPGSAGASANFAHTLGFPTSGPVFNLPAGFTVNSLDGTVVNNLFTPVGTVVTPEPNTLLLMCSGVFALSGRIVSRRKRAL